MKEEKGKETKNDKKNVKKEIRQIKISRSGENKRKCIDQNIVGKEISKNKDNANGKERNNKKTKRKKNKH